MLVTVSWAGPHGVIFSLMGAVFAPAIGTIVADAWRQKGQWRGIRMGLEPCGVIAWAAGLLVGIVPLLGTLFSSPLAQDVQPASLLAFFTARHDLPGLGLVWPGTAAGPLPDLEQEEARSPDGETRRS